MKNFIYLLFLFIAIASCRRQMNYPKKNPPPPAFENKYILKVYFLKELFFANGTHPIPKDEELSFNVRNLDGTYLSEDRFSLQVNLGPFSISRKNINATSPGLIRVNLFEIYQKYHAYYPDGVYTFDIILMNTIQWNSTDPSEDKQFAKTTVSVQIKENADLSIEALHCFEEDPEWMDLHVKLNTDYAPNLDTLPLYVEVRGEKKELIHFVVSKDRKTAKATISKKTYPDWEFATIWRLENNQYLLAAEGKRWEYEKKYFINRVCEDMPHIKNQYDLLNIYPFSLRQPIENPYNAQGRIVRLSLAYNNIQEIPQEIKCFRHLRYLDLSHTELSNLPLHVYEFKTLDTLFLSSNKFSEVPENIGNLIQLKALNLNHNQLNKLPHNITKLQQLHTLSLINNLFTEKQKEEIISWFPSTAVEF